MTVDPITQYLLAKGPTLSSTIKEELLRQGVTDAAARQRLSRASKQEVRQLKSLFPDNTAFLYLDNQYKKTDYWLNLLRDLTHKNTAYGRALNALIAKGGIVSRSQFPIISGAPIANLDKHLSSDIILSRLQQVGLVEIRTSENEQYVCLSSNTPFEVLETGIYRNRQIVENMVIEHVKEWLKKASFVSYDAVTTRDHLNHKGYGPFGWDIVGPSYLRHLTRYKPEEQKLSNGFAVADIFIGQELSVSQVAYFAYKATTCSSIGIPPAVYFLVADWFAKDALELGRKNGFIFVTPTTLFGKEVAESLKELIQVLDHAAAVAAKEPDKISKILNTLGQSDVNFNNLKGALFNLIVGHMVLKGEGGSIDIGQKVYCSVESQAIEREMDVRLCVGDHTVTVYECKGYKSPIRLKDVEKWVAEKISYIYKSLRQEQRFSNVKISFEFWTSSSFESEALKYLEEKAASIGKFEIRWKDRKDILEYSMAKNLSQMRALIKEYY